MSGTYVVAFVGDIILATRVAGNPPVPSAESEALALRLTEVALSRMPSVGKLPQPELGEDTCSIDRNESDEELSRALLQLEDMSRTSVEVTPRCQSIDDGLDCDGRSPRIGDGWERRAQVTYGQGGGPFTYYIMQQIVEYASADDAAGAVEKALNNATGEAVCEVVGAADRTITYNRTDDVAVGERSGAWTVSVSRQTSPIGTTLVIFQRGRVVSIVKSTDRGAGTVNAAAERRIIAYLD